MWSSDPAIKFFMLLKVDDYILLAPFFIFINVLCLLAQFSAPASTFNSNHQIAKHNILPVFSPNNLAIAVIVSIYCQVKYLSQLICTFYQLVLDMSTQNINTM